MKYKIMQILLTPFLLMSCSTPYQQYTSSPFALMPNQGFSEYQIDENTFSVSFQGNGLTSSEKTYGYALRRAAEVTIKNYGRYFLVINERGQPKTVTSTVVTNNYTSTTTSLHPATTLHIKIYSYRPSLDAYDAYDILGMID